MSSQDVDLGTPFLKFSREGHIAVCTIDRPDSKNALTPAMYYGLKKAVATVNAYSESTALIITGVGDVFAPGGELRANFEDANPQMDYLVPTDVLPFEAIRDSFAPVIAAVNGLCWGGGLLTAMLADVAVCSDRATFRVPELTRGIPDLNYAAYLPAHVGVSAARDLMLTGRILSAGEARDMGLISRVVDHETVMDQARETAEDILRTPSGARAVVKRALTERYGRVDTMSFQWYLSNSPELAEGMLAFAEKRSPDWIPEALRRGRL